MRIKGEGEKVKGGFALTVSGERMSGERDGLWPLAFNG